MSNVGDPRAAAGGVEPDDLDGAAIVLWSFVSIICVVLVMFVAAALYNWKDQLLYRERVVAADTIDANRIIHEQQGLLTDYRAPQPGGEHYIIPIDVAKDLVLAELNAARASE